MEVVKVPLPIDPSSPEIITCIYPFIIDKMNQTIVEKMSLI